MLIGDDTPAPTGEAAPHQENPSEAPATTPETPESDSWEARYENLRTDHGRLGSEVGSLRQKLAAQEQEIAESRRWREQQLRNRDGNVPSGTYAYPDPLHHQLQGCGLSGTISPRIPHYLPAHCRIRYDVGSYPLLHGRKPRE